MKKINTIFFIMLLLIIFSAIPTCVKAVDISPITNSAVVPSEVKDSLTNIWSHVSVIITTIGVGIAVVMLIVVAIKYMAAAPNEKAGIKKYLIIYTVGAIFILCCVGVVNLLKGVAEEILL